MSLRKIFVIILSLFPLWLKASSESTLKFYHMKDELYSKDLVNTANATFGIRLIQGRSSEDFAFRSQKNGGILLFDGHSQDKTGVPFLHTDIPSSFIENIFECFGHEESLRQNFLDINAIFAETILRDPLLSVFKITKKDESELFIRHPFLKNSGGAVFVGGMSDRKNIHIFNAGDSWANTYTIDMSGCVKLVSTTREHNWDDRDELNRYSRIRSKLSYDQKILLNFMSEIDKGSPNRVAGFLPSRGLGDLSGRIFSFSETEYDTIWQSLDYSSEESRELFIDTCKKQDAEGRNLVGSLEIEHQYIPLQENKITFTLFASDGYSDFIERESIIDTISNYVRRYNKPILDIYLNSEVRLAFVEGLSDVLENRWHSVKSATIQRESTLRGVTCERTIAENAKKEIDDTTFIIQVWDLGVNPHKVYRDVMKQHFTEYLLHKDSSNGGLVHSVPGAGVFCHRDNGLGLIRRLESILAREKLILNRIENLRSENLFLKMKGFLTSSKLFNGILANEQQTDFIHLENREILDYDVRSLSEDLFPASYKASILNALGSGQLNSIWIIGEDGRNYLHLKNVEKIMDELIAFRNQKTAEIDQDSQVLLDNSLLKILLRLTCVSSVGGIWHPEGGHDYIVNKATIVDFIDRL